jgi:sugar/nucleoside kinase (ribokinase family)
MAKVHTSCAIIQYLHRLKLRKMSLVNVGTVAFDAIETPFGKTDKIVGGASTYISLAANLFYSPVRLVSVIGDDFDMEMLQRLRDKGIDTEGLQIKEGEKTFFWSGKYHYDLNTRDTLVTELNVLEHFQPMLPDSYQDCEYLMLGNLAPSVQLSVLSQFRNRPRLVVLDTMNFWMDIAMEELKQVIEKCDVLSINDEEARQLTGEYSLVKAARMILTMGPKYLIIKKGEHGALLFGGEEMFFAPALPIEDVVDPTGAGDTFAGGMLGYLASKDDISFENMKRAVIAGSAMASFTVERFGTERLLEISIADVHARIAQFQRLVAVDM